MLPSGLYAANHLDSLTNKSIIMLISSNVYECCVNYVYYFFQYLRCIVTVKRDNTRVYKVCVIIVPVYVSLTWHLRNSKIRLWRCYIAVAPRFTEKEIKEENNSLCLCF